MNEMNKSLGVSLVLLFLVLFSVGFGMAVDGEALCVIDDECGATGFCINGFCYDGSGSSSSAVVPSGDLFGSIADMSIPDRISNAFGFFNGEETGQNRSAVLFVAKWLMLFMVVLLIYSGMSMAKFPQNSGLRFTLSLVIGFLAIVFINNSEIFGIMQSYQAMGISVSLLIPMMALTFVTYTVAISLNSFGILLQRVAWFIYSAFLFFKMGGLLLFKFSNSFNGTGFSISSPWIQETSQFLFGQNATEMLKVANSINGIMLLLLVAISIVVFWWFVIMNESTVRWIAHSVQVSDLDRFKDNMKRAAESDKAKAEVTRG